MPPAVSTSLCIATITVSVTLQQFVRLATLIGYSCVENNEQLLLLPRCGPLGLVSRGMVTKIMTIKEKLQIDKYKNVTGPQLVI